MVSPVLDKEWADNKVKIKNYLETEGYFWVTNVELNGLSVEDIRNDPQYLGEEIFVTEFAFDMDGNRACNYAAIYKKKNMLPLYLKPEEGPDPAKA